MNERRIAVRKRIALQFVVGILLGHMNMLSDVHRFVIVAR
jgi:hypothetical protein